MMLNGEKRYFDVYEFLGVVTTKGVEGEHTVDCGVLLT